MVKLEVYIKGSLNVGLVSEKIVEIFIQCIPYMDFSRVLNAINVARKVFDENNIRVCK